MNTPRPTRRATPEDADSNAGAAETTPRSEDPIFLRERIKQLLVTVESVQHERGEIAVELHRSLQREGRLREERTALVGALEFYADEAGDLWEKCEDDGEHGLRRQYITGTSHPREVARRALSRATNGDTK